MKLEPFCKEATKMIITYKDSEEHDKFVNCCACVSSFIDCFPLHIEDFQATIPALINVVGEKLDILRRNAAVLLAKMTKSEKNMEIIRKNHGMDVLMSVGGALSKPI